MPVNSFSVLWWCGGCDRGLQGTLCSCAVHTLGPALAQDQQELQQVMCVGTKHQERSQSNR